LEKDDLQIAIDNVLDLWAVVDPSRIQVKYKLHVLPHIREDIRRFGPAILFSTEIFECWNAVFRMCSVLSNHHAPSRDIAITLSDMERFKHQVSGGHWRTSSGFYVQAGAHVRNFLVKNTELQRRLGWVDELKIRKGNPQFKLLITVSYLGPGSVKQIVKSKRQPANFKTCAGKVFDNLLLVPQPATDETGNWIRCHHVISQSRDVCKEGSWVFVDITDIAVSVSVICGSTRSLLVLFFSLRL